MQNRAPRRDTSKGRFGKKRKEVPSADGGKSNPAKEARKQFLWRRLADKHITKKELKDVVKELQLEAMLSSAKEYTVVVNALGRKGLHSRMLEVLQEQDSKLGPNTITYSAAIAAVTASSGEWATSLFLLRQLQGRTPPGDGTRQPQKMRAAVEPNVITYNAAITAMEKAKQWEHALEIFGELIDSGGAPTEASYSAIMGACRRSLQWQKALHFNEDMLNRGLRGNLLTWTSLILALEKSNQPLLAVRSSGRMKKAGFQPDEAVYDCVLRACAKGNLNKRAIFLLNKMIEGGLTPSAAAYSSAIAAVSFTEPRRTLLLFEEMKGKGLKPSAAAFVGVMGALEAQNRPADVLRLFEEMKASCRPTHAAYAAAMRAIDFSERSENDSVQRKRGIARTMLKLFKEMRFWKLTPPDASCFDLAVKAHASIGEVSEAKALFDEAISLGLQPGGEACEDMLRVFQFAKQDVDAADLLGAGVKGYAAAGNAKHAARLLRKMRASDFHPGKELWSSVIRCCQVNNAAKECVQLDEDLGNPDSLQMDQQDVQELVAESTAALVSAKARQARWGEALQLFRDLRESSQHVANEPWQHAAEAAVQACQFVGGWREALWIMQRFQSEGLEKRPAMYEATIAACAQEEQHRAASALLKQMKSAGLQPSEEAIAAAGRRPVTNDRGKMERRGTQPGEDTRQKEFHAAKGSNKRDLTQRPTAKVRRGEEQPRPTARTSRRGASSVETKREAEDEEDEEDDWDDWDEETLRDDAKDDFDRNGNGKDWSPPVSYF